MGSPFSSGGQPLLQQVNNWTQVQKFADGAVGAPSIAFNSAANYGIFYNGSAVRVAVAGAERLCIANQLRTGGAAADAAYGNTGDIITPAGSGVKAKNTAKAWVRFNGTGTVTILDSYNVTSITDNGVGNYTVNLTNAQANTNYLPAAIPMGSGQVSGLGSVTTTSFGVAISSSTGAGLQDCAEIQCIVFAS